jgi:hypothetical protein
VPESRVQAIFFEVLWEVVFEELGDGLCEVGDVRMAEGEIVAAGDSPRLLPDSAWNIGQDRLNLCAAMNPAMISSNATPGPPGSVLREEHIESGFIGKFQTTKSEIPLAACL